MNASVTAEEVNVSAAAADCPPLEVDPMKVGWGLACMIISAVGILGNSHIGYFYYNKKEKTPSEYIILNLAVLDCFYCCCTITSTAFDAVHDSCQSSKNFNHMYFAVLNGLFTFVTNYSFICVFIITINRYVAVCRPMEYREIFTYRKSYILLNTAFGITAFSGVVDGWLIKYLMDRESQEVADVYSKIVFFIRLALIATDVITMVYVYIKIVRRHGGSFGDAGRQQSTTQISTMTRQQQQGVRPSPAAGGGQRDSVQSNGAEQPAVELLLLPIMEERNGGAPSGGGHAMNDHSFACGDDDEEEDDVGGAGAPAATKPNTTHDDDDTPAKPPAAAVEKSLRRNRSRPAGSATKALFIISVIFITIITPFTMLSGWQCFRPSENSWFYHVFFYVVMFMFNLNFVSNYFVYLYFNTAFRRNASYMYNRFLCCH